MSQSDVVVFRAYAKVNLALAVGAPIAPPAAFAGYHPITSWMSSVDLFDEVEVTPLRSGPSTCAIEWAPDALRPSPIDWAVEKDLAMRGHRLLEAEAGRPMPVALRVVKRIPVGGGLGGGSADAAAAMLAVRKAFALPIETPRLAELSAKLGSDVAYFLDEQAPARSAIVSHLGERIERVAGVQQPIVLFFPAFGCPTGAVYKAFDSGNSGAGFDDRAAAVREMVLNAVRRNRILTDELFNDLAAPARHVEPRLQGIIDRLAAELNARVHVTGSGSTLFVLPATPDEGRRMAARAPGVAEGVTALCTRIV